MTKSLNDLFEGADLNSIDLAAVGMAAMPILGAILESFSEGFEYELDGGETQEFLIKSGLGTEMPYVPAVHGEIEDASKGDNVVIYTELALQIRKISRAMAEQARKTQTKGP